MLVFHPASGARADRWLLASLRDYGDGPRTASATRVLSRLGEHGGVWLAIGLMGACLDRPRRSTWVRASASVGTAHAISMMVKPVVGRQRPELPGRIPLVPTSGRNSFPSSHAASAAAAAVAFSVLLPGVPIAVAAVVMCVSRVIAGVHYPSDVAAGAALGVVAAGVGRGWVLRTEQSGSDG
ncbi:phosphatase PAP2 family protein [Streptomyces sp. NPDC057686]|uniref:phosphatase PAP2 family protein n=1 Tax=Streptomyces sp. NPDC057686 TaxID=3346212 RepID=UPI0036804827